MPAGRYVATILAIAATVGAVAAVSTYVAAMPAATARATLLGLAVVAVGVVVVMITIGNTYAVLLSRRRPQLGKLPTATPAAVRVGPEPAAVRGARLVRLAVAVAFLAGGGLLVGTVVEGAHEQSAVYAAGAGGLLAVGVLGAVTLALPVLFAAAGPVLPGRRAASATPREALAVE